MGDNSEWLNNPQGKIAKGALCPACGRYNSRDVVGHALVIRDRKVLMIKRGIEPMKGWWALPAGYLDWDESLEENTLRELKEEAGMEGEIVGLLGIYSDPNRDENGQQNVGVVYVVKPKSEARVGEEVTEVSWFGLDALPDKIAFDHRKMILDYVEKNQNDKKM